MLNGYEDRIVCPYCKSKMGFIMGQNSQCSHCGVEYKWEFGSWTLIPHQINDELSFVDDWQQVQSNGNITYQMDPIHNLSVEKTTLVEDFLAFCNYHGRVLDVGCGPQSISSYAQTDNGVEFWGIDPLVENVSDSFYQFRAIGEFMPFEENFFDCVLFVTSIDHVIDLERVILETQRVLKPGGKVYAMIGEKDKNTPVRKNSPDWYLQLQKPENAVDVFHMKRSTVREYLSFFELQGFQKIKQETYRIDEYRKMHFVALGQ